MPREDLHPDQRKCSRCGRAIHKGDSWYGMDGRRQHMDCQRAEAKRYRDALAHIRGFFFAGWPDDEYCAQIGQIASLALDEEERR
jgi:hypothetical protein